MHGHPGMRVEGTNFKNRRGRMRKQPCCLSQVCPGSLQAPQDTPIFSHELVWHLSPFLRCRHQEQLKVMFIGGPNIRKDYHIEEGEEVGMWTPHP